MKTIIPIAHDFICPWCWIAIRQVEKLRANFRIDFDWQGYELFPNDMEWPSWRPTNEPANKPATMSRLEFLLDIEGVTIPVVEKPAKMRTHNAHLACEFAKANGVGNEFTESLYHAYWLRGTDINNVDELLEIGKTYGLSSKKLKQSIEEEAYACNLVMFDDPAHSKGVYNVPTYFIGESRLAEQPYSVIETHLVKVLSSQTQVPYWNIQFPSGADKKPYVILDMVASIDGKIITGSGGKSVTALSSPVDRQAMKNLTGSCDAVLIGANTLRNTAHAWNPDVKHRLVMTRSGDLDWKVKFLKEPGATVILQNKSKSKVPKGIDVITEEGGLSKLLGQLKSRQIDRLLILGGSEINAQFLKADLVDEVFLTISPNITLGSDLPTIAGGEALNQSELLKFKLISHIAVGNDLFLRYRKSV